MQQNLIKWFNAHKRDLPWREELSPYRVWVSEVMLQQTQVAVVIPYFQRWMERFPTVQSLAEAHIDEVIKLWEGLGYYSRARNLHEGAKQLCSLHNGSLPDTPELLSKIKGIGPYTTGAILSFAFRKKAAAVDGNVIRVLSRYLAIEDDISKPSTVKALWGHAEALLPDQEPWNFNEGLIELGATVCTKNPQCQKCPIKSTCQGFSKGIAAQLPIKNKKTESIELFREVAVIECDGEILIRKCPKGEIMQDLYEFPFRELQGESYCEEKTSRWALEVLGVPIKFSQRIPSVSHGFTKYRVKLYPSKYVTAKKVEVPGYQWVAESDLIKVPFNSGHRRILSSTHS